MKADEIREFVRLPDMWDGDYDRHRMMILGEIAAQLAELTEPLAPVNEEKKWVWLTYQGVPFVIDPREVTGVARSNEALDFGTHVKQVCIIGMKGQPWSKSADGTVAEVCKKLGIPVEG